jgi:hypothetical protein
MQPHEPNSPLILSHKTNTKQLWPLDLDPNYLNLCQEQLLAMDFDPRLPQISTIGLNCVSLDEIPTVHSSTQALALIYLNPHIPPKNSSPFEPLAKLCPIESSNPKAEGFQVLPQVLLNRYSP